MAGGGHEGHGHGHYPGYPTEVWTPTGGWYADPKLWRRNTFVAMAGIFAVCVPIFIASVKLEVRSHMLSFALRLLVPRFAGPYHHCLTISTTYTLASTG